MRLFLATITLLLTFTHLYGQSYNKYIIQFTDKNNSPYSLLAPSAYLSPKAISRRIKYGIPIDSSDLPVNPAYIQAVLNKGGVSLLVQSRWLNDILVYTQDQSAIDAINTLPFVKKTVATGFFRAQSAEPYSDKFTHESTGTLSPFTIQGNTGDVFDYASSYKQVHIHNGEFLHNKGYTGQGMTIAVLDAGFYHYTTLAAFDSIRLNNQVLGVKDFVNFDNSVTEDDDHGMECLSTIAANIPGVMVGTAPKANFWLLRSENVATEYPIEEHNWVAAAEYADSAGADIISSSLGYNQFNDAQFNHTYADFYNNRTMVTRGAAYAAKKGMIVTNSAGNEGNKSWHYLIFPSDADSVCAVGAVTADSTIASFSSYGYPGKVKPNIVSVGSGTTVFVPSGQPAAGNGTSFSNPNINGLIACLWQAFPQYNNMTILDAVYKSANRYNNPDDRFGYGIPDMKKAYAILKKKQNDSLYGGEWLFATPKQFNDTLHVTLVGQVDGPVKLTLLDENGKAMAVIQLTTQQQEVYDTAFTKLATFFGGNYQLVYTDSLTQTSIPLTKPLNLSSWLVAKPNPFGSNLSVYINAPETGNIAIRLIDAAGKIITRQQLTVTQGNIYTVKFNSLQGLARGVYFIQYIGQGQKRVIRVFKG